ncbi:MAG TPA: hypothetical protein VH596_08545 [Terriglobales bacterium]|jgi:hypothetical protein
MNGKTSILVVVPALVTLVYVLVPAAAGQHVEIGGFGDYTNTSVTSFPQNAFGLGARIDINMHRLLQAEFETAYDVKHANFVLAASPGNAILTESKLGILHLNGGLKLQTRGGSFFLFAKGGVNWYDPERTQTTISGMPITTSFAAASPNSFTQAIFYPGGGIGFHAGPLGIRLDVGDEIYWSDKVHNNLRVTFGPTIRF